MRAASIPSDQHSSNYKFVPSNRLISRELAFSDRFKTAEDQNKIRNGPGNFRSPATENVSDMRSIPVRMRQADEKTAAEIFDIARNVENASRMVQRITTVVKNQKTVNSIVMNLHPVRSASVPGRK